MISQYQIALGIISHLSIQEQKDISKHLIKDIIKSNEPKEPKKLSAKQMIESGSITVEM